MFASTDRRTVSVEEAARKLGISRNFAYQCARRGELAGVPVIRLGRRFLVLRDPLDRLLSGERVKGQTNAD